MTTSCFLLQWGRPCHPDRLPAERSQHEDLQTSLLPVRKQNCWTGEGGRSFSVQACFCYLNWITWFMHCSFRYDSALRTWWSFFYLRRKSLLLRKDSQGTDQKPLLTDPATHGEGCYSPQSGHLKMFLLRRGHIGDLCWSPPEAAQDLHQTVLACRFSSDTLLKSWKIQLHC